MLSNTSWAMPALILLALASYLIGAFSASITISRKMPGGDVRNYGSGNAGATNMARIYGMSAGVVTLALDALKAFVCAMVGQWLLGDVGLAVAGAAAIIGHCYPVYYKFKGGKGVSTGAALGLALDWRVGLAIIAVFFAVALLSKKVSLGSVCAALSLIVFAFAFGLSAPRVALAVFAAVLVVARHHANIKRLLNGTEPDFKPAKRAEK